MRKGLDAERRVREKEISGLCGVCFTRCNILQAGVFTRINHKRDPVVVGLCVGGVWLLHNNSHSIIIKKQVIFVPSSCFAQQCAFMYRHSFLLVFSWLFVVCWLSSCGHVGI